MDDSIAKQVIYRKLRKRLAVILTPIIIVLLVLLLVILIIAGILGAGSSSSSLTGTLINVDLSEATLQWLQDVTDECNRQGVPELVVYVMAIIQVESGGIGPDVMQSSESAGLGPNGFTNAQDSIAQGVRYLKSAKELGETLGINNMWAAVQSYNFGTYYLSYLAVKGLNHSIDVAETYSKTVVAPSLGNSSGSTYSYVNAVSQSYGKTYLYLNGGNYYYAALVAQYITTAEGAVVGTGMFLWPSPVEFSVSSGFGPRGSPGGIGSTNHMGIDIPAALNTPVLAAASGTVVTAGWVSGYGNYILIDHNNGYKTAYAHMNSLIASVGDTVVMGQQIGYVGSTGNSTGPHIHFEVYENGVRVDPMKFF